MSRALVVINSRADRDRASNLIEGAPWGTRVEFKAAKRSRAQNDRMWAMLTEIARRPSSPWHGVKLRADDWKLLFMDAPARTRCGWRRTSQRATASSIWAGARATSRKRKCPTLWS